MDMHLNLSHMSSPGPLWSCSLWLQQIPGSMGTAGLLPDDHLRKLSSSPFPRNWGVRPEEVRIKSKAKVGTSPLEAMKANAGGFFSDPLVGQAGW